MKKIRIGNDIEITWSIFADKEQTTPYTLAGRSLTLKCSCDGRTATTLPDFSINGNAVIFTFYGKDQERTGVYTLTLVENEGREDMHTVDSCDAFQLVARSCDVAGDACGCGNIEVESVELTSTLSADVVANYPSLGVEVDSVMSDTSENPVQNKVVKKYVDDVANVATTPIYEALATIADEVMTRDKDAVEGNVAVFDGDGYAVDSGKSVEDFKGADGEDGVGVPAGGSAGQVLSKRSDADYDTEWVDIPQGGGGGGGTADGAVLYTPQTLTDEQKSQVAKNIGQPRERLILEWENDQAEVLQPTAYDAETGYFTVDTMPSWLAEDGAIVPATINYSDTLLVQNMYGTNDVNNVPFSKDNTAPIQYIHRVSSSQFQVLSKDDVNSASNVTIDANTKCDYFYYTNTPTIGFKLASKGEYGIKRFRVIFSNACVQFEKFADGITCDENLVYQNTYTVQWARIWNAPRPFANSGEYLIEVDLDNGRYRYLSYEIAGLIRTSATASARSYLHQKSMNIQPWSNVWGWSLDLDNVYFKFDGKYIAKDTTIKLYEIIE